MTTVVVFYYALFVVLHQLQLSSVLIQSLKVLLHILAGLLLVLFEGCYIDRSSLIDVKESNGEM